MCAKYICKINFYDLLCAKYKIINRTRKNDVKTIEIFFLIENPFFRVPGKKFFFLCEKDDLLCAKVIFPYLIQKTSVNAIGRKEKSATKLALRKQDEIGQALNSSERNEKEVSPSGSIKV